MWSCSLSPKIIKASVEEGVDALVHDGAFIFEDLSPWWDENCQNAKREAKKAEKPEKSTKSQMEKAIARRSQRSNGEDKLAVSQCNDNALNQVNFYLYTNSKPNFLGLDL